RFRWSLESSSAAADEKKTVAPERDELKEILLQNRLTVHYQPIFSSKDGSVFGYESLARVADVEKSSFLDARQLFNKAAEYNLASQLDVRCRENALRNAARLSIADTSALLFVNICPEALLHDFDDVCKIDILIEELGLRKDRIVLEVNEENVISNFAFFKKTIDYYNKNGYKLAIDNFGAGYGGLKMLSIIEPNFVKIDRHFISNIDKAIVKFNLVDAVTTACHRMGIRVVAGGIETKEELEVLLNLDCELLQGFLLGKSAPTFTAQAAKLDEFTSSPRNLPFNRGDDFFISDIVSYVEPIAPAATVLDAFNRFMDDDGLALLPVVQGKRVAGMLFRTRFLERQFLGKLSFGMHLNKYKDISHIMEQQFVALESNTLLEDVAKKIRSKKFRSHYNDICVTKHGRYLGIVSITDLLDALTEKNLILAKGSNPLSGMPGNEFIQKEIEKRISQNMHFDVCYIDIDHFKPYNDHYGFGQGDNVIKTLAEIVKKNLASSGDDLCFAGHIGGDDFIVITRPRHSLPVCSSIIADFERQLPVFHGEDDCCNTIYQSTNRKGETESFGLLSLSIGIVSTEVINVQSFAQLSSC
ncbi:MAG TPA: bifunctional diguanylate cyclase/phosphodiesterase, partial [Bacteroidota bacterium]|nr:bifunctional diguanylate cyclase/phosphodiesterase [Bacteroidota bacterium]